VSALSRRKGAAWQAELARRWRENGTFGEAHSTQGAQVRSGRRLGKTPPDIDGTPFWCEAKHTRACNPVGALKQAEAERAFADDPRPAIAVVRPHRTGAAQAVVSMRVETFELLIAASNGRFRLDEYADAIAELALDRAEGE
jgi:hypothetical protein